MTPAPLPPLASPSLAPPTRRDEHGLEGTATPHVYAGTNLMEPDGASSSVDTRLQQREREREEERESGGTSPSAEAAGDRGGDRAADRAGDRAGDAELSLELSPTPLPLRPSLTLPPASVAATAAAGGSGFAQHELSGSGSMPRTGLTPARRALLAHAGGESVAPGLVDSGGVAGELELRVGAIIEAFATTRPVVEVRGAQLESCSCSCFYLPCGHDVLILLCTFFTRCSVPT